MIRKYNDLFILGILWLIALYSIITTVINSFDFGVQTLIGYGLLLGVTLMRCLKIRRSKTLLAIVLLVGSLNLIQFSYFTLTVMFSWSPMGQDFSTIGIQPISFSLLILLIWLNFSAFTTLVGSLLAVDPKIERDRKERIIAKNYEALKAENDDHLRHILQNRKMYQVGYVRAAQRVIDKREAI